jgi:hypothetical protein
VSILVPPRRQQRRSQGLGYGVSLPDADRVSLRRVDYQSALGLLKVLGAVACPVLAVAAFQILRVNTRFLPRQIRPPLWRRAALALCGVGYAALATASLVSLFASGE